MEAIAAGIEGLRIMFVNVFGVTHVQGSWTLVDAGLPYSETLIREWAEKHFRRAPNAIVLTHGHFDHVSAARELADHWDVPVYAHSLERPYLAGEQEYPPPNFGAGGGLMSLLSPMLPRGPFNIGERLRLFDDSTAGPRSLPEMPGWRIIHTPGHTPGHVAFFRERDRMLLAGDAFCTTKPESFFEAAIAQKPELHGPPAYFTSDWTRARQSVELLASLQPEIVAPGHGKPIAGPSVPVKLQELAAKFDEVAVPSNRQHPAA
jgi:glyoxylase-like metal-dependent hydrolase (beta-lactamase superfamily II)